MKRWPRKLKLTQHAWERKQWRGITDPQIRDCLRCGHRERRGRCVLYFSLHTRVALLVDVRRARIVTLYYLSQAEYQRLEHWVHRRQNETQG